MLREGILTSEPVNALSCPAEVFYRRVMSVVDDFGRYYAKPSLLRAHCYPLQLDKVDDTFIMRMLVEVCNTKPALAVVYEVEGKQYIQLLKFRQQVRAKKSKFPEPPKHAQQMLRECAADAHLGGDGGVGVVEDVVVDEEGENQKVSTPACPHQEILKLYAEHLPMGRQIKPPWNGARARDLTTRWKEMPERQSLKWWDQFFEHCSKSPFLTGRVPPRQGRKPFEVSIDWILNASNFQKIVEGAYDD